MTFPRRSGILMHPASLPSPYGIGDFGDAAYQFVDFLANAGQSYWQILPLTPTGYADSPYQSPSAFAGNSMLISPQKLLEIGHLTPQDLQDTPQFNMDQIEYGPVREYKTFLLDRAFSTFKSLADRDQQQDFIRFCKDHAFWLDDYALYMSLKEMHDLRPWHTWEPALVTRKTKALAKWRAALALEIETHKYRQWQFFNQWLDLKQYANDHRIHIIGDIPLFISLDSADAWAHPQLFHFDENLKPTVVSGVPPDCFSETGQLWGHPLYDWESMAENDYAWWITRFKATLKRVDIVRVDHFRGFYDYWEVPAGEKTAINGQWLPGPGTDFFRVVTSALGSLDIIAEDLGGFDEASRAGVNAIRDAFGYPGMKVFQFAFDSGPQNEFLPHNYTSSNCVVYTGTHDNDTLKGWYQVTTNDAERDYVRKYLGSDGTDIVWDMIRLAWASSGNTAITTTQDLLELGHEARINLPGTIGPPNWCWRMQPDALTDDIAARLLDLTNIYGRRP